MTRLRRNNFFKAGIFLAAAFLGLTALSSLVVIPVYPALLEETVRRSPGVIQGLAARFFPPAPYVPFVTGAGAVLYALTALILILAFFEKTNAPEILFIYIFALSLAFESLRIMIPLKKIYNFPNIYLTMNFRILLFARYAGLFSLFTASVCAAGLEVQKKRNSLMAIALAALIIALGTPIDTLAWDSSLSMIYGYAPMFRLVEGGLLLITVLSFLIAAYSRGAPAYIFVSAGSLLACIGRNVLLSADTWLTPFPGLLLLALGTWFICTHLHKIYLWL